MLKINLKNRGMYRDVPNEGAGGGSAELPKPGADGNSDTGDFNKNDVEDFSDMWQNKPEDNDDAGTNANVNANGGAASRTSEEVLQEHIATLDFGKGIDMQAIMNDVQNGDMSSMQKAFTQIGSQAYTATLTDANRLMQSKINDAVTAAVEKAGVNYKGDKLTDAMHTALPFTKDPAMSPVARGILGQFLKKGLSDEEALNKTKAYFKNFALKSAKDLGVNAGSSRPGSGQFNQGAGGIDTGEDDADEIDWVSALSGK